MRARFASASSLALVCASVFAPAASAVAGKPDTGALSSRLYELSSPALRAAAATDQALAVSLPASGPGSLSRIGGAVVVEVRTSGATSERVGGLRAAGAEILAVAPRYDTVTVAADERDLRALADARGVLGVDEVLTPMTGSVETADGPVGGAINACTTGVVSEGNTQLNAGAARTQFDVDGSGVKVGILSDSYDTNTAASKHAADDIASGDLPGPANPCGRTLPVDVLDDSATPTPPDTNLGDEGRAMLQIVHDLAPGASLAFATASTGETAFASNIRALANSRAKVIADDVIYFGEPMFQDGIIANAVTDVTNQGVAYFSMAFNDNIISGGNDVGSFEAPAFRQSASCPAGLPGYVTECMDFNPAAGGGAADDNTYGISIPNNATLRLVLQWAQPQSGVTTDLDAYLVGTGLAMAPKSETNLTTQKPLEVLGYKNMSGATQTVGLVINRYTGIGGGNALSPRLKLVFGQNGGQSIVPTENLTSSGGDIVGPTIFGHNGTAAAQTVGAVPFNNSTTPEVFSSRGPVTHYFAPVNGTTAAAALASPEVLSKPDVAATDRGITSFFGGGNRFAGTSAAAPHAAAVAALQLSANSALTQAQVKATQKATGRPVGAFGPLAVGGGLIDAQAAIAANPTPPPTVAITARPAPVSNVTTPAFAFGIAGKPASISCILDGAAQPCGSPFMVTTPLADGNHTLTVQATDFFGQSGEGAASFTVDTAGPVAPVFDKGPKKRSTSKKATFTFSGEPGATFECALDDRLFAPCTSPATVKVKKPKPKAKRHTFTVEATDALGNAGATSTYKWKVQKKRPKHR